MVPVAPRSCSCGRSIWCFESFIIWQVPHKLAYFFNKTFGNCHYIFICETSCFGKILVRICDGNQVLGIDVHNESFLTFFFFCIMMKQDIIFRSTIMNFYLTDKRKKRINSVQSIPMKHCAEYGV